MFTDPPDARAFNPKVWEAARQVPYGKVATYGKLAELVGAPQGIDPEDYTSLGPRWVGTAMAACPADVPWHRIVNAQGRISIRTGGGHLKQRALLEAEGIEFDDKDRIDLNRFGWGIPPLARQISLFE